MRAIIIAAGLLLVAAGCQTTPEDPQAGAAVEDRSKPGAKPGAQPVERPQVGKLDVTKPGASDSVAALKDPSSPLSKRQIFFDYDRFDVKDEYRPLIEAHAKYLRENPNAKMLIQGNADERGSREYNVALGQKRAESVTKLLVLLGARADQIEAISWGEEKPRGNGHDEKAWSENRRADFAAR